MRKIICSLILALLTTQVPFVTLDQNVKKELPDYNVFENIKENKDLSLYGYGSMQIQPFVNRLPVEIETTIAPGQVLTFGFDVRVRRQTLSQIQDETRAMFRRINNWVIAHNNERLYSRTVWSPDGHRDLQINNLTYNAVLYRDLRPYLQFRNHFDRSVIDNEMGNHINNIMSPYSILLGNIFSARTHYFRVYIVLLNRGNTNFTIHISSLLNHYRYTNPNIVYRHNQTGSSIYVRNDVARAAPITPRNTFLPGTPAAGRPLPEKNFFAGYNINVATNTTRFIDFSSSNKNNWRYVTHSPTIRVQTVHTMSFFNSNIG